MIRRRVRHFTAVYYWFSVLLFAPCSASANPNIVVILADDMGYGDVRAHNDDSRIATPNLDRLAAEGMYFSDAHSPSAVCTPTRYSLLTGRYAWRSRLTEGVLDGYGEPLLEDGRTTLPEFLRMHGYHTGIVGKWHLGLAFQHAADGGIDFDLPVANGPHTHGFDYSYIIPASLDFPPYVYLRNGVVTEIPSAQQPAESFPGFVREGPRAPHLRFEDVLDELTAEAVWYINRRAGTGQPFFLYLPLTAPHKPVLPHARFRGTTELGPYGDFIHQVDWSTGEVLKALDEKKIADSTLVIFTSDNGSFMYRRDAGDGPDHVDDESIQAFRADRHRSNYSFRGTKADIWEGGHRVPFLVRWPGVVEPESHSAGTICQTDIFATCADIIGSAPADDVAEDSFSILPALRNPEAELDRAPVIHHSAAGMFAIRDGAWKLVLGNGSGGREQPRGAPFERPFPLFNIASDRSESNDVSEAHTDIVHRLETTVATFRETGRSR